MVTCLDDFYESYNIKRSHEKTIHDYLHSSIRSDTLLLDLTRGGHLVHLIERFQPKFFQDVIISRNEAMYSQTQTLARWSFDWGFDGIVYHPVRNTKDVTCCGKCLVMFNEDKVVKVESI